MRNPFFKRSSLGGGRHHHALLVVLLIIFLALFMFVLRVFIRDYILLRHSGILHSRPPRSILLPQQMGSTSPLVIANVDLVENWMTFDYLNASFGLPPEILRDGLHITDPVYPRLSIRRAAKEANVSRDVYLEEVKNIIREYLAARKMP